MNPKNCLDKRSHLNFVCKNTLGNKQSYDWYVVKAQEVYRRTKQSLRRELTSNIQLQNVTKGNIQKIKDLLLNEDDPIIKENFKKDFKDKQQKLKDLAKNQRKIEKKQSENEKSILSYEKFLKLFEELRSRISKIKKMQHLNEITKIIFLNFVIENRKVASYKLKSPFKELFEEAKAQKVTSGGTRRLSFEHFFENFLLVPEKIIEPLLKFHQTKLQFYQEASENLPQAVL